MAGSAVFPSFKVFNPLKALNRQRVTKAQTYKHSRLKYKQDYLLTDSAKAADLGQRPSAREQRQAARTGLHQKRVRMKVLQFRTWGHTCSHLII